MRASSPIEQHYSVLYGFDFEAGVIYFASHFRFLLSICRAKHFRIKDYSYLQTFKNRPSILMHNHCADFEQR